MQSHAQRPSRSPPPPARFYNHGTGAVAAAAASEAIKIPANQVHRLIGPGGATIKDISAKTGTEIHVDDDGTVRIDSSSADCVHRAKDVIAGMFKEVQVGETYQAQVVSIKDFGCFVKLPSGRDGLVHISELASHRVSQVEDVVKIGQMISVKCIGIDENGRIRLSLKAAINGCAHGGGAARAGTAAHF
jgi:polyribonucleotide nucleotidyltransferase